MSTSPRSTLSYEKPDIFAHLLKLNMGPLYTSLQGRTKEFGYLPLMASCSEGQIGALCAESFCERVLSQCNLVLTEGNTLLSDSDLEMIVVLRMNREFMQFMRSKYAHLSVQDFNQTIIKDDAQ